MQQSAIRTILTTATLAAPAATTINETNAYAYGANIGWIAFESNGNPRVDLSSGNLDGYVWSANCGWICLGNGFAFVRRTT